MRRPRRRWARPFRASHQRLDRVPGGRPRGGRACRPRGLGDRSRPRKCQPATRPDLRHSTAARSGTCGVRPGARGQPQRCPQLRDPGRRADVVGRPAGRSSGPGGGARAQPGPRPPGSRHRLLSSRPLRRRGGDADPWPAEPAPAGRPGRGPAVLAAAYAQLGDTPRRHGRGPSWRRWRPSSTRSCSSACSVRRPIARTCATASSRPASAADHSTRGDAFMGLLDRRRNGTTAGTTPASPAAGSCAVLRSAATG